MKDTAILTLKLFVITAIVATLLGAVNMITKPIIASNAEKTFNEAMKEVLPNAKAEFKEFNINDLELPSD
ncbi:MAG: electron transporter RnfG, partial [Oscillospiraceae bacterium]